LIYDFISIDMQHRAPIWIVDHLLLIISLSVRVILIPTTIVRNRFLLTTIFLLVDHVVIDHEVARIIGVVCISLLVVRVTL